jgi:hypothetical protein
MGKIAKGKRLKIEVINKYQCSNTGVIAARGKRKRNNE